jgi:hypothetical protein
LLRKEIDTCPKKNASSNTLLLRMAAESVPKLGRAEAEAVTLAAQRDATLSWLTRE